MNNIYIIVGVAVLLIFIALTGLVVWFIINPGKVETPPGVPFVAYSGSIVNLIGKKIYIRRSYKSPGNASFHAASVCSTGERNLVISDYELIPDVDNSSAQWIFRLRQFTDNNNPRFPVDTEALVIESVKYPGKFLSIYNYQENSTAPIQAISALKTEVPADPKTNYWNVNGDILFDISKHIPDGTEFLIKSYYGDFFLSDSFIRIKACNDTFVVTNFVHENNPGDSDYQQIMLLA